jgi:hypothetical protein
MDIKKIFRLEYESLSRKASDRNLILVKTRYISNGPGLRVLIEETPSDRILAPVFIFPPLS